MTQNSRKCFTYSQYIIMGTYKHGARVWKAPKHRGLVPTESGHPAGMSLPPNPLKKLHDVGSIKSLTSDNWTQYPAPSAPWNSGCGARISHPLITAESFQRPAPTPKQLPGPYLNTHLPGWAILLACKGHSYHSGDSKSFCSFAPETRTKTKSFFSIGTTLLHLKTVPFVKIV